ncbi:MAG TPA: hypothetical protein VFO38_00985 [Candidatus Saccharimonadales bacterium]|nr:hypothetical protein [Candidatus Saccharimonadales bacterium]
MKYFATFIPGTRDIIYKRLNAFSNQSLSVTEISDGLVLFESTLTIPQLSELRFFNNVFLLIHDFGIAATPVTELLPRLTAFPLPQAPYGTTFTLKVSQANEFVAAPRQKILDYIAAQTGKTATSHKPDDEFLLLARSDGRSLWGWRLPRAGFKQRNLEQGEIRPELAHIMGLVAGVTPKSTVLDPFAGYGGIVRECLQGFHAKEVIAIEQNQRLIPHLKSIPRLIALHGDAKQLGHISSRNIDRIITDPPWGEFTQADPNELRALYRHALVQMHRVLRAKGAVIMLTAAPFMADVAAETSFDIVKEYPILVSGRKATIYKLRRLD